MTDHFWQHLPTWRSARRHIYAHPQGTTAMLIVVTLAVTLSLRQAFYLRTLKRAIAQHEQSYSGTTRITERVHELTMQVNDAHQRINRLQRSRRHAGRSIPLMERITNEIPEGVRLDTVHIATGGVVEIAGAASALSALKEFAQLLKSVEGLYEVHIADMLRDTAAGSTVVRFTLAGTTRRKKAK